GGECAAAVDGAIDQQRAVGKRGVAAVSVRSGGEGERCDAAFDQAAGAPDRVAQDERGSARVEDAVAVERHRADDGVDAATVVDGGVGAAAVQGDLLVQQVGQVEHLQRRAG